MFWRLTPPDASTSTDDPLLQLFYGETLSAEAFEEALRKQRATHPPQDPGSAAQAAHQPDHTFMYLFEWAATSFGGRLGSCHALEIPFVFDNLAKPGTELLMGEGPPQSLADAMHASWLAFARTGSPSHEGLPAWPAFDPAGRATLHFGVPCHLGHDEDTAGDRAAWDGLL